MLLLLFACGLYQSRPFASIRGYILYIGFFFFFSFDIGKALHLHHSIGLRKERKTGCQDAGAPSFCFLSHQVPFLLLFLSETEEFLSDFCWRHHVRLICLTVSGWPAITKWNWNAFSMGWITALIKCFLCLVLNTVCVFPLDPVKQCCYSHLADKESEAWRRSNYLLRLWNLGRAGLGFESTYSNSTIQHS